MTENEILEYIYSQFPTAPREIAPSTQGQYLAWTKQLIRMWFHRDPKASFFHMCVQAGISPQRLVTLQNAASWVVHDTLFKDQKKMADKDIQDKSTKLIEMLDWVTFEHGKQYRSYLEVEGLDFAKKRPSRRLSWKKHGVGFVRDIAVACPQSKYQASICVQALTMSRPGDLSRLKGVLVQNLYQNKIQLTVFPCKSRKNAVQPWGKLVINYQKADSIVQELIDTLRSNIDRKIQKFIIDNKLSEQKQQLFQNRVRKWFYHKLQGTPNSYLKRFQDIATRVFKRKTDLCTMSVRHWGATMLKSEEGSSTRESRIKLAGALRHRVTKTSMDHYGRRSRGGICMGIETVSVPVPIIDNVKILGSKNFKTKNFQGCCPEISIPSMTP